MGKGVRTVQRWEQDFGLPVRRPQGSSKKAILARPTDLDAWVALRCGSRPPAPAPAGVHGDLPRPLGASNGHASLGALSALNAHIETSRMLRNTNLELMQDVYSALDRLRLELRSFRNTD
jgi:hypothetical protein